jgi:hypothetical protein
MRIRSRATLVGSLALAALLILGGCTKPTPTLADATAQILTSEFFETEAVEKVTIGFTLPAGADGEPLRSQSCPTCGALEANDLARYDRDPNDPKRFTFVLTPKGVHAALDWVEAGRPQSLSEGAVYLVGVAEKSLIAITGMRPMGDGVVVSFNWRWKSNSIGNTLGVDPDVQHAEAFFRFYPVGWRIEGRIEGME